MTGKDFRRIDLMVRFLDCVMFIAVIASALVGFIRASAQVPSHDVREHQSVVQQQECLKAAQRVLGPRARLLKCGELNQTGILESIAAIPVKPKSHVVQGIFATDLIILRGSHGDWKTALRASRLIQNDAGYIGIDYIDECSPFWADHIEFWSQRPDGHAGLVVSIQWRGFENDTDPMPTDISWDNAIGRYREITADGFQSEVKKPPHECPGGVSKGAP